MKKSLVTFIINQTKSNALFESRLSHIFANNFGGEAALEQLCYGTPVRMEYDKANVLEWLQSEDMKVTEVTGISLLPDGRIRISWKGTWKRYFKDEESAKTTRRWDGYDHPHEGYPIEAWIPGEESSTFEEIPDEIIHIIRDVDNL